MSTQPMIDGFIERRKDLTRRAQHQSEHKKSRRIALTCVLIFLGYCMVALCAAYALNMHAERMDGRAPVQQGQ